MSRIGWKRHHVSLALAALLGLLAPLGCAGNDDENVGGDRQGAQGNRTEGADEAADQGGVGQGDQGGAQGGEQAGGAGEEQGGSQGGGQGGEGQQEDMPAIQSDGEIAWVLRAFNMGEIQYSQAACRGAESPEVHAFAESMIAQHIEAIDREGQLFQQHRIVPAGSARGQAFIGDMDGFFQDLSNLQGAELDDMYMEGQVQIHLILLDTIDMQLLPVVQSEALRGELETMRAVTLQHLVQAEEVYCALGVEHEHEQEPGQEPGQEPVGQATQEMVRQWPLEEFPTQHPGSVDY